MHPNELFEVDRFTRALLALAREHSKRKTIWPGIQTFEALQEYMSACKTDDPASAEFGYLIRTKQNEMFGTMHVHNLNWAEAKTEIGYWLHHSHAGQGIATKCVLILEKALRDLGFRIAVISTQQWNEASWRVAEKAGYKLREIFHKDRDCLGCDDCTRIYEKDL